MKNEPKTTVTFRKQLTLNIDMHRLMQKCVCMLTADFTLYDNLEDLVYNCLELLYDVDLYGYDNTSDTIRFIAKILPIWCLRHNYTKEHDQLKNLG